MSSFIREIISLTRMEEEKKKEKSQREKIRHSLFKDRNKYLLAHLFFCNKYNIVTIERIN